QITQQLQQKKLDEQSREELNLLYVALTRAREQLYISGSASNRRQDDSWYQIIMNALDDITQAETTVAGMNCKVYRHLSYDTEMTHVPETRDLSSSEALDIDERLLQPIKMIPPNEYLLAPSLITDEYRPGHSPPQSTIQADTQALAKWRGTLIHRTLELLCHSGHYPASEKAITTIRQKLETEVRLDEPGFIQHLEGCIDEAIAVFDHHELASIFDPAPDEQTYDEMPLMYLQEAAQTDDAERQAVYGFVDRIIKSKDTVLIIDYKSHQIGHTVSMQDAAQQFSEQLNYYRQGIQQLWPEHEVRAGILFTSRQKLIWLD
ncbi:MAG TPA: hypothetical protein ENJ87_09005, partial [Gammaproteobacteria bacterium]|nr:hypothetical protein [Gammaproteobacteria bacterium]